MPDSKLSTSFVNLGLSADEVDQLTHFIEDALYDPNLESYTPSSLPSGLGFPNNDSQTRIDLGF